MSDLNVSEVLRLQPQQLWLISVPELGHLTRNLAQNNLSESVKLSNFLIPKDSFRIGTLDQLVGLNDELDRIESTSEQMARRLASFLFGVINGNEHVDRSERNEQDKNEAIARLMENLKLNQNRDYLHDYVKTFRWDAAKYPIKGRLLKEVLNELAENVYKTEQAFKKRSTEYNNINRDLGAILKKQTGSLLTRDLTSVVDRKKHLVQNSEYLETLVVAVPTSQKPDWLKTYETLADYVVPRSSVEVVSDPDYTLFTVTLFQRCIDEFKTNCAKKKFTIRDVGKMFAQTSGSAGSDQNNNELSSEALLKKLRKDKARQFPILVKWLQLNYRDCVSIMMHLKSLKCFIESVLRYGLPVKFDSIIIQPPNKAVGKLKMVLDETYKAIDRSGSASQAFGDSNASNLEGVSAGITSELSADYRPYVYNLINCDFIHSAVGFSGY